MVHIIQHTCFTGTLDVKRHEKRPKRSKWSRYGLVMNLADYSLPTYTGKITHQMRRMQKPTLRFTSGGVVRVVLFFLHHGFVPLGFPDKVLMRQHEAYYKSCMVMASKGECYKSWSGLPLTKTRGESLSATSSPTVAARRRESRPKPQPTQDIDSFLFLCFSSFHIFSYIRFWILFFFLYFVIYTNKRDLLRLHRTSTSAEKNSPER